MVCGNVIIFSERFSHLNGPSFEDQRPEIPAEKAHTPEVHNQNTRKSIILQASSKYVC